MDKNCNIVQDLIPLCAEKIASDESVEFVKEHCKTCETCKKIYKFSGVNIAKSEKEYDDKMRKIWENIERQENAKKRRKVIISGICGFIVSVLIFLYVSSCFHGTVWAIGINHNKAREDFVKYFSQFELYEPTQRDIETAVKALKEHFRENNKGEILLDLIYDEYITYNTNYENYTTDSDSKTICFTGTIVNSSELPKLIFTDVSTNHKWKVSYNTTTGLWEVASIANTVMEG